MADPTVAELLEQSRAAHLEYRNNLPRMGSGGAGGAQALEGDVVKAAAALNAAATLRKQAHDQDPDHLEDAWAIDAPFAGADDHALMTWYAEHLARVDDPVAQAAQRMAEGVESPAVEARREADPNRIPLPAPVPVPVTLPVVGGGGDV